MFLCGDYDRIKPRHNTNNRPVCYLIGNKKGLNYPDR